MGRLCNNSVECMDMTIPHFFQSQTTFYLVSTVPWLPRIASLVESLQNVSLEPSRNQVVVLESISNRAIIPIRIAISVTKLELTKEEYLEY